MNKIFWTLSVSLLTLGLLFGFSLTASQVSAADGDGAAAASSDAGAKKTTKKKKKSKVKASEDEGAKAADSNSDEEKPVKKSKKKKKSLKSSKASDSDAVEENADEKTEEKAAQDEKVDEKADEKSEEKADDSESVKEITSADASALEKSGSKAGETVSITVGEVEYTFCWCPEGTFQMGAPENELGYTPAELQHTVKISKGFWMLQSEVTQEMYESITGENPSYFSTKGFGKEKGTVAGREETKKFPVDRVSYNDATAFCKKLSEICKVTFALPTEAQWEYACRAGTSYSFYTDKAPTPQQANYKAGENVPESTDEVGRHGQNPWNLYDMMGNVDEWCRDLYGEDYYASSPAADPTGPESNDAGERVLRGGSYANMQFYLRSATRNKLIEAAKGNKFDGFRFITVPGGEVTSEAAEPAEKAEADEKADDEAKAESEDEEKSEDDAKSEDEEKSEDEKEEE